jgi:catechol 2,3-dioxygenase-like lactoylglutathione lyase family enzyme
MGGEQIDRRHLLERAAAGVLLLSGLATPALSQTRSKASEDTRMSIFKSPMINLYSRDLARAVSFYADLGFVETFRTPSSGPPVHIELQLDGFTLGIATVEAARGHGLRPSGDGRWIEIVLWTDDTDSAVNALTAKGTPLLSPAHDFADGQLRSAWIADPDGNPIQLVQQKN